MKKCDYCAKEISYFDQYCDDECHIQANKFYEMSERYGKIFSFINAVCIFGIPIGILMLSFVKTAGIIIAVASCIILGLTVIILPFPTESMISKFKIQKAVKITRILGLALIGLGIVIAVFAIFIFK